MKCTKCGNQTFFIDEEKKIIGCTQCYNIYSFSEVLGSPTLNSTQNSYPPYFDIRDNVLFKYSGGLKDVVVPEGVTEIRGLRSSIEGVFPKSVRSITLPESLEEINLENIMGLDTLKLSSNIKKLIATTEIFGRLCNIEHHPSFFPKNIFFAEGTKRIDGDDLLMKVEYSSYPKKIKEKINVYLPNSLEYIKPTLFTGICHINNSYSDNFHFLFAIFHYDKDNINPKVLPYIWKAEDKCTYCGGNFKYPFFGKPTCTSCGKEKNYTRIFDSSK